MSENAVESYDVAILGGGSAAEALIRGLDGSEQSIVVFEPKLVGGECPFVACMPSKSMLHDAARADSHEPGSWDAAVIRRDDLVNGRDDSQHRDEARRLGATIVSAYATLVDEHTISADGRTFTAEHIVVATGVRPVMPDIDGIDRLGDRLWNSEDALVTTRRPERLAIIGGGVIGSELAQVFAEFATSVTVIDPSDHPADDLHPTVGELISESLERSGATLRYGRTATAFESDDHGPVTVVLDNEDRVEVDQVLMVVGRRPNTDSIGLESVGLDPDEFAVDDRCRVDGSSSMFAIGDVAGREQYTHVANLHGAVVADQITGSGDRRLGESVIPACVFVNPPVMVVGPTWADLDGDADVVWSETDVEVPRLATDEMPEGFLAIAARRSTGTVVAAHGIGPKFDEIVHALVIAIDGAVPVTALARTIQPFPTVGEVLGVAFADLLDQLT